MNSFLLPPSAQLVTRILDPARPTEPMIDLTDKKPRFSMEKQGTRLLRATPESVGVPSEIISELLGKIREDETLNMHEILILREGKIICEASFGAQRSDIWKYTFSACKSITSLAIGMLIEDGLLSLDDKIVELFPKEIGTIAKLKLKELRVEDLLTMRAGLQFAEVDSMTTPEWIRGFLGSTVKGEIGETFHYNSINTYLLAALVVRKSGMSLSAFLDKRLFAPLGIVNYYWERSPENIEKGGWGLYLLPEDFAKIAIMVMNHGIFDGKRIISGEYLRMATSKQAIVEYESRRFDYGYQIWVGKNDDSFLFNGMLGQNVIGFRESGVIVVSNAGNGEFFQTSNYFDYLKNAFGKKLVDILNRKSFGNGNSRVIRAQRHRLDAIIRELSAYREKTLGEKLTEAWRKLWKKDDTSLFLAYTGEYRHESGEKNAIGLLPLALQTVYNCYSRGLVGIDLSIKNGSPCLVYRETDNAYELPFNFCVPNETEIDIGGINFRVATSARLRYNEDDKQVLIFRIDFLETPCSRVLKLIFGKNGTLRLCQGELPGEEFVAESAGEMLRQVAQSSIPIVSGLVDRFGEDYMRLKVHKAFSPKITLQKLILDEAIQTE